MNLMIVTAGLSLLTAAGVLLWWLHHSRNQLERANRAYDDGDWSRVLSGARHIVASAVAHPDPAHLKTAQSAVGLIDNMLLELGVDAPRRLDRVRQTVRDAARGERLLDQESCKWFIEWLTVAQTMSLESGIRDGAESVQESLELANSELLYRRLDVKQSIGYSRAKHENLDFQKSARMMLSRR